MSLERKERRKCDKCGEIISGAYYSCEKQFHTATDGYATVPPGNAWLQFAGGSVGTCSPPPKIDICQDCWEKMDKK